MGYQNLIIGLTGNAFSEDKVPFLNSGADIVLSKPLKANLLEKLLSFMQTSGVRSRWEEQKKLQMNHDIEEFCWADK